jgi:hypothetical protein
MWCLFVGPETHLDLPRVVGQRRLEMNQPVKSVASAAASHVQCPAIGCDLPRIEEPKGALAIGGCSSSKNADVIPQVERDHHDLQRRVGHDDVQRHRAPVAGYTFALLRHQRIMPGTRSPRHHGGLPQNDISKAAPPRPRPLERRHP